MSPSKPKPESKRTGRGAQRLPKRKFRQAILDAALKVFSEKGFHDAQMGEIAQRARVAVGTVYNVFKSKADLYRELILEHGFEMFAAFNEVLERGSDPLTTLFDYIRVKGELYEENQALVKLFFSEGRGARLNVRALLTGDSLAMYDALLQRLAETFEEGIRQDLLERLDAFDLAIAIDSLTNSFIVLHMDHPEQHPYAKKIPTMMKLFFGSVVTEKGRQRLEAELALEHAGTPGPEKKDG